MIKLGNTDIVNIYVGSDEVSKIYIGNTEVWSAAPPHDYSQDYFTIEMLSAGTISWAASGVSYSTDNGSTWSAWDDVNGYSANAGDKILFKSSVNTGYNGVTMSSTGYFNVMGNTMSLFYGDNFSGQTSLPGGYCLTYLMKNNTLLLNANNLIFPATSTQYASYQAFFDGCTSLVSAPELPASRLSTGCYQEMFRNCASLTKAPVLSAATGQTQSYYRMFQGCTSLGKVVILTKKLGMYTCYHMFDGCSNLTYIKCLATDISASNALKDWVQNVASAGTFVKDANMVDWATGASGIPSGWTVESI